ncbi:hypothetical protein T12_436 [Trichinella patagoniensis]|uniref:Uncharacterized protein n=1 Tax=Trichinella patagoniensis TaxID=990121 RepID=A0A0V0ZUJ4_9BILA|nr:hypothetical protein T12_436 [Trichinella patagoniensis]
MCNATVTSSCIIGALNLRKRRCRLRSCKRAWFPVPRLAWLKSSGQALSINSWPLSTYNLTLRQLPAGSSWLFVTGLTNVVVVVVVSPVDLYSQQAATRFCYQKTPHLFGTAVALTGATFPNWSTISAQFSAHRRLCFAFPFINFVLLLQAGQAS